MNPQLEPHEQRILNLIDETVASLIEGGRATLDVSDASEKHGALFELKPTVKGACPVIVHCDAPGDLDLYVGTYQLTVSIWRSREWAKGNHEALENELRDWLSALLAGDYSEEVRLTGEGQAGKGRGTIQLPDGPQVFSESNITTIGKRGPWQRIEYRPY